MRKLSLGTLGAVFLPGIIVMGTATGGATLSDTDAKLLIEQAFRYATVPLGRFIVKPIPESRHVHVHLFTHASL
jgi:hypothetical protein